MLAATVARTQTVAIAAARDPGETPERLSRSVDSAVQRHSEAWKQNLIQAWGTLDSSELNQVCVALNERDQGTFMRFAMRVAGDVQLRNEPLLNRAGAEVLEEVFSAAS